VISVPGDRADALIAEAGRAAAHAFDRIIIRDDRDLRNRQAGEVPRLLARAAKEAVPECECRIILDEREAVTTALNDLGPREFVVIVYDDLSLVMDILQQYGASPIDGVQEFPIAV
jgi:cyanophycin synthetase